MALSDRFTTQAHLDVLDGDDYTPLSPVVSNSTVGSPYSQYSQQRAKKSLQATKSDKEEERRNRRVFLHLEALCLTSEARRSLKAFQTIFARKIGAEYLLPAGATMEGDASGGGFMGKVGRVLSSGNGFGRKESYLCISSVEG